MIDDKDIITMIIDDEDTMMKISYDEDVIMMMIEIMIKIKIMI